MPMYSRSSWENFLPEEALASNSDHTIKTNYLVYRLECLLPSAQRGLVRVWELSNYSRVIKLALFCSDSNSYQRSEEHTSELQSLRHLVCRLLLEKKKKLCDTVIQL